MLNLTFLIGQVSRILGIPADTLRYYDRTRLLTPDTRGENRYRLYSLGQLEILITIKVLREMGVPIDRIRGILSGDTLADARALVAEKKREVALRQEYLNSLSQKLVSLDERFRLFSEPSHVELMPRARCWVFMTDSIMESGAKDLDRMIERDAGGLESYKWLALCHAISVVAREDLLKGNVHHYTHNGILSFSPIPEQIGGVNELPECLCVHKCVVIKGDGYEEIDNHYEKMLEFIDVHGLAVEGDSLEINVFNQYERHYIEIWIPVKEDKHG